VDDDIFSPKFSKLLKALAKSKFVAMSIAMFFFLAGAYAKNFSDREINIINNRITIFELKTKSKFKSVNSKFDKILTALCIIEAKACRIKNK